jgi:hypothetical protein
VDPRGRVTAMPASVRDIMTTDVVTVRPGTSCREQGSGVLGAGIADRVEHIEGVIGVRDRFVYPARSAHLFPSDPGL